MVRLKHRYLLLDILYPDPSSWPKAAHVLSRTSTPQSQLQIHSPTSDVLTPGLLAKMVREQVGEMFGDWGVGKLGGGGISGEYLSLLFITVLFLLMVACSLTSDK